MDVAGSFRAQRPANGGSANRQATTHTAGHAPQVAHQAHRTLPQQPVATSSIKRFVVPIAIALTVIIIAAIGWFFWSRSQAAGVAIDTSKYQAVFFTNGQVYFGKLQSISGGYMKLTDVYYLQAPTGAVEGSENPQSTATNQSNMQLIKLGDEIHGPEDTMIISKDQILFYENLKSEGNVAQSIEKHKNAN